MKKGSVTAIIMIGSSGSGDLERQVAAARWAAATDSLANVAKLPGIQRLIVAHSPGFSPSLDSTLGADVLWEVDPPGQDFHFGQRLAHIISKYQLDCVLYLGAGSMPLLPASTLEAALTQIDQVELRIAITNNIHSADWVAFNHAPELAAIAHWLNRDNMFAWRLRETLGYVVTSLPPSAGTRVDIDTPFDLQLLALHPDTPPHLKTYLQQIAATLNLPQLERARDVLKSPGRRVTLIGRVSAEAWQLLGLRQHWTRVFSEERGMVANQRQAQGQVFSIIADHIERVGEAEFFAQLARTSDLVLFDTRVYLAHHNTWPPNEERFASDLGLVEKISDARLRRLTEAALAAPIPILLGGHNVVSGGLYALMEIAS